MTTLITGASGFVGGWITRLLAADQSARQSEPLRILIRPTSKRDHLRAYDLEFIEGDLLDPPSLERALAGVTHVYHAAGWISFKRRDAAKVRQVNYDGTLNLFQAALQAGVEKIVYTASIFAQGPALDPAQLTTEDTVVGVPVLQKMPYIKAKLDAETAAQDFIARGLPLIRLYPGICLGPEDFTHSSTGTIDAWLHGGLPALVTDGGMCIMDIRDAAAAHIAAMQHGKPGAKYLATGYNVKLVDLFNRLGEIAGRRPPLLRLPARLGVPLAGIAEALGIFPALDAGQARLMGYHWWFDTGKALNVLGVTFRPLDVTLRETIAWLLEN
jgi:dihydroflavonol-4-reductase